MKIKVLLEISDTKLIKKLEKICKDRNFFYKYSGQLRPNYTKAVKYMLSKNGGEKNERC